MAIDGGSSLARLRERYEDRERTCVECGHRAERAGWQVVTVPGEIRFRRICPSCGAVDVRSLRYERRS